MRRPVSVFARSSAPRAAAPEAARRQALRNRRWAVAGAALGAALGVVAFLPASLVAGAVGRLTQDRLVLAEAEGTVWNGSALAVLTGGPGSQDASVLPSRLAWRLRPRWNGASLHLEQDCCMSPGVDLKVAAGWSTTRVEVADAPGEGFHAQWPAGWVEGLGALWKTLKPGGQLRLGTKGLALVRHGNEWQLEGEARLEIRQASARLTTLGSLGSYQVVLAGAPGAPARLTVSTLEGALQLEGSGEVGPRGVRFRGQARAAPGSEDALNNLLNIIGRRSGATSLISIG